MTNNSDPEQDGRARRPLQAAASPVGDDAFLHAQRHSQRVRLAKLALPGMAAAMAIAFFAYSWMAAPPPLAMELDGSAVQDGKLVMANPKLEGYTSDNLRYTMTAVRAVQDVDQSGVIDLEEIAAKVPLSETNWAAIDASAGTYDRDANSIDVASGLTVKTTDGMVARLESAEIDLSQGGLTTRDPVDIRLNGATVRSEALTILDHGKILIFEDRVRVDIRPQKLKTAEATAGGADASQ